MPFAASPEMSRTGSAADQMPIGSAATLPTGDAVTLPTGSVELKEDNLTGSAVAILLTGSAVAAMLTGSAVAAMLTGSAATPPTGRPKPRRSRERG
jgi:hypothetical protein